MMGIPNLQRAFAGLGTQTGPQGGGGGLTALLSMFSKFPSTHPASQEVDDNFQARNSDKGSNFPTSCSSQLKSDDHPQYTDDQKAENQHKDFEETRKLGEDGKMCNNEKPLSPLEQLLRKPLTLKGQDVQGHDTGDQDEMYKMLQGICGSVSAIRFKSDQDMVKDSADVQTRIR